MTEKVKDIFLTEKVKEKFLIEKLKEKFLTEKVTEKIKENFEKVKEIFDWKSKGKLSEKKTYIFFYHYENGTYKFWIDFFFLISQKSVQKCSQNQKLFWLI